MLSLPQQESGLFSFIFGFYESENTSIIYLLLRMITYGQSEDKRIKGTFSLSPSEMMLVDTTYRGYATRSSTGVVGGIWPVVDRLPSY